MTRHEALAVAVRLFAIALVLLCVRALPGSVFALNYMQDQDWHVQVVLVGGANAFILLAAAALWKSPFRTCFIGSCS